MFTDGFANDDGAPNDDLSVSRAVVTIEPVDEDHTR
jgi:hypothetical protein